LDIRLKYKCNIYTRNIDKGALERLPGKTLPPRAGPFNRGRVDSSFRASGSVPWRNNRMTAEAADRRSRRKEERRLIYHLNFFIFMTVPSGA
jgi:hypothetical protein